MTNLQLVEHCKDYLGVHYLYGAKGQKMTESQIRMLAKMYPSYYGSNRLEKALKWVGDIAVDCSGLISSYTGTVRNTTGYYNTAIKRGEIEDGIPETPGLAVWYKGHIGVYIGGGKVIEARGFNYGVVETDLKNRPWTHWLKLCDIEYIEQEEPEVYTSPLATMKKGDFGVRVGWLQERLNSVFGAGLVVDEEYGSKTQAAVYAYQDSLGWNATGSAGKKTIVALHDGRKD